MHRTSNKLKFIHFADDTTVYISGSNLTVLCADVCEELNVIDDWLKANRLSLNKDKTYFMMHTHNKFNINVCMNNIGDTPIKYVRYIYEIFRTYVRRPVQLQRPHAKPL